jgi:hypothetical protein
MRHTRFLAASTFALLATSPVAAQRGGTTSGAFVVVLGKDTIAVEQYTRTGNRVEGDLVTRQPTTLVTHYVVQLKSDGMPETMEVTQRRADGTPLPNRAQSMLVTYTPDTVTTLIRFADSTSIRKAAIPRAMPFLSNSFAMYEIAFGAMRAAKIDSTTVALYSPGAQRANMFPMALSSTNTARAWYFGAPQNIGMDPQGRILLLDATATTNKILVNRLASLDVKALAANYASVEQAGRGLGAQASPRDTARATINGSAFLVDYGRPSTRGRDVWKNGVLGDTLWRTGANQATHITLPVAVSIAGRDVPAGTYTLWTHTVRDRAQ